MRKLREGAQVELETPGGRNEMALRSGRSTFTLACLPPEDYPVMSAGELPHHFALSAAELRSLIDRTRFAISTEETRYYLNGIYLHATKNNEVPVVRAVATDGHRLARVEMTAPEGAAGMPGIIVPRKTVLELRKLVEEGDGEDEVQIALGDTKIRCAIGEAALTSKLIDGTFPDYDRVIPANNDKILEVDCKSFAEAVDRVSTISTERSRAVKLAIEKRRPRRVGDQPGKRHRGRGTRGALSRAPRSRSASTRAICSTSPSRSAGEYVQFQMSDAGSPTILRDSADQWRERALCADADARVTRQSAARRPGFAGNSALSPHIEAMLAAAQEVRRECRHRGSVAARRACRRDPARPHRFPQLPLGRGSISTRATGRWGPVVLTGPNGAGKTNLLEAMSFLSPGRGLRNARLGDIDRRDGGPRRRAPASGWAVAATVETRRGAVAIGTGRDRGRDGAAAASGARSASTASRRAARRHWPSGSACCG